MNPPSLQARSPARPSAACRRRPGLGLRRRRSQAGAALMVALVLMAVVATLASGMVWQQWKAVRIEAADRARTQSGWLLLGGLDYSRLILREDARTGQVTHLGAPWATPLKETRLSAMLAQDRDRNADADLEAFLSGDIEDAQARWNLRQLVVDGKLVPAQVEALGRLCTHLGLAPAVATRLAEALLSATLGTAPDAPLMPESEDDLAWLGIDPQTAQILATRVVLLPVPTPVNLNTASREVLAAALGIDPGSAERIVAARTRGPFTKVADVQTLLGLNEPPLAGAVDVRSNFFLVRGRLRLESRLLQDRYLIERRPGPNVLAVRRQRSGLLLPGAGATEAR